MDGGRPQRLRLIGYAADAHSGTSQTGQQSWQDRGGLR